MPELNLIIVLLFPRTLDTQVVHLAHWAVARVGMHTAHSTSGSVPCEANPISEESQIPPKEQLSQLEIEQETWFLQTLEEFMKN